MAFSSKVCGLFLLFLIFNGPISSTEKTAEEENVERLTAASNDLAIRLYKQLAAGYSKNIFFSPLSLSMALGMLFHGARGKTVEVLRNVLGYEAAGLNTEEVANLFYHLLQQELPPANSKNLAYTLDIANQILIQEGLQLKKAFKEDINNLFLAPVYEVNFKKDTSKIVDDVNHWVEEKTHGKIKTLLDKVDPGTAMLLLNAVYFKGTWETQFETSSTKEQVFYNNGVETNEK